MKINWSQVGTIIVALLLFGVVAAVLAGARKKI